MFCIEEVAAFSGFALRRGKSRATQTTARESVGLISTGASERSLNHSTELELLTKKSFPKGNVI